MDLARTRARAVACLTAFASVAVLGCGAYRPINAKLDRHDPTYGYRAERIHEQRPDAGDIQL